MAPLPDLSRRSLLQLLGVTAGAAAVGGAGVSAPAQAEELMPFAARGKMKSRPNFLVIVVDEMRYAPVYESSELLAWRKKNLTHINSLSRNGFAFSNHHIMSAACAPSRASLFTGQYPSLHGVSQTSGAAKSAIEEDLYWLDPTTVPTMGHYFRAAGYRTFYKGKWHVSDADLYQPGSYNALPTYNSEGNPEAYTEQIYLEANRLNAYGFDGWVGPEPHGQSPLNSASSGPGGEGRDEVYARQASNQLKKLRDSKRPWLLVTSFVNPHDITIWGDLTLASKNYYLDQQLRGSTVPRRLFDARYETSKNEDLSKKPTAQGSYGQVYPNAFQPTSNDEAYRRFYYQLHANVDEQIGKVLKTLEGGNGKMARDTVVIFLSDHGELLGAHGGLFQKWHQAYDEVLRVPFVVHNPRLFPEAKSTDVLTSHADLLPTMLGLAGANMKELRRRLRKTHTQVTELVGRDLSPMLLGERPASKYNDPQYFMTDDEPTRGSDQVNGRGQMYQPVVQPNHVETVVAELPTGSGGAMQRWKYNRYFDNPQFWSSPNSKDVTTFIDGNMNVAGTKTATTTVKKKPVPDQIEVYNVTVDPTELKNLADDPASAATVAKLASLLKEQRRMKRLQPKTRNRDKGLLGGIGV